MRVLTLTAPEDVFASGPIGTQVFPVLEHLATGGDVVPSLASVLPGHRRLRAPTRRAAVRTRLADAGIAFSEIVVAARSRVYVGRRSLKFLAAQSLPRLRAIVARTTPDLVHARGHVAAHLAARLGVPYLFDCRGHYREEAVHVGAFARGAPADRFWAREEPVLVAGAAAVVAVSDPFREILGDPDHLTIIPCFAASSPGASVELDAPLERFMRARPTLCYVGSLTSWYAPEALFGAFARIAAATAWNVLVVTGEAGHARAIAARAGVPADRLAVCTLDAPHVAAALARSRATIWAAFGSPTALHATQLGIKFAEYAAAGRPMIVSSTLGAAAALVAAHDAGVVVDDADTKTLEAALGAIERDGERMGRAARALFEARFRLEDAVAAYRRVYEACAGAPSPASGR